MRKTLGIALVAIMLVILTLACGPTPTPQVIREKETVVVTEKETVVVEKEPGEQTVVEFWTTDNEKARMDVQNELATRFEEANPDIDIQVVAIDEASLSQRVATAVGAGQLPDVMRFGLEFVPGFVQEDILDVSASTQAINELGADTFYSGVLGMVESGDGWAAMPIDGWVQGIWYRRDMFEQEGLDAPNTFEKIMTAAQTFQDTAQGQYGIVIGTDPEQTYTQQVFEHFAMANGAFPFRQGDPLTMNTEEMVDTLDYYTSLAEYGPPGANYWREARLEYLAGNAAMMFYSTYIMDDIAGLVEEFEVGVEDLAANTGMVPLFQGPMADSPASYGQIVVLGITQNADTEAAQRWVEFLLSDGYMDIINMSPMGKMPMRPQFVEQWRENDVFGFYSQDVVEEIAGGFEGVNRWGIVGGGLHPLVSDIYGQQLVPVAIGNILDGSMSSQEAADWLQQQVEQFQTGQ